MTWSFGLVDLAYRRRPRRWIAPAKVWLSLRPRDEHLLHVDRPREDLLCMRVADDRFQRRPIRLDAVRQRIWTHDRPTGSELAFLVSCLGPGCDPLQEGLFRRDEGRIQRTREI